MRRDCSRHVKTKTKRCPTTTTGIYMAIISGVSSVAGIPALYNVLVATAHRGGKIELRISSVCVDCRSTGGS